MHKRLERKNASVKFVLHIQIKCNTLQEVSGASLPLQECDLNKKIKNILQFFEERRKKSWTTL
jgi:hypothetical protein